MNKNGAIVKINITSEPIRLGQFLKHANHVQDGIEAKFRIQSGDVYVNNILEKRRGRQLTHGDRVLIDAMTYEVETTSRER